MYTENKIKQFNASRDKDTTPRSKLIFNEFIICVWFLPSSGTALLVWLTSGWPDGSSWSQCGGACVAVQTAPSLSRSTDLAWRSQSSGLWPRTLHQTLSLQHHLPPHRHCPPHWGCSPGAHASVRASPHTMDSEIGEYINLYRTTETLSHNLNSNANILLKTGDKHRLLIHIIKSDEEEAFPGWWKQETNNEIRSMWCNQTLNISLCLGQEPHLVLCHH